MKILLDFDGVMVITPAWRSVHQLIDGFMAFDEECTQHLVEVLRETQADIVLTTTHRIHYDTETWRSLLKNRGIVTQNLSKVNDAKNYAELEVRCDEIMAWVAKNPNETYVIIDDDKSLRNLPDNIKINWVETNFYQGFTEEAKQKALSIIRNVHQK